LQKNNFLDFPKKFLILEIVN